MQIFVEARYEYHWAPLVGCLVAQLDHLGLGQPSYRVGAVTGLSYQRPGVDALPSVLAAGLEALGADVKLVDRKAPSRLQRWRARRLVRRELRADRAVAAFGVGESAFGPTYGLIVGCDDERAAWRRDGPLTEQVSPWLAEAVFDQSPRLTLIALRPAAEHPTSADLAERAGEALSLSLERARRELECQVRLLEGSDELAPQRHAYEAQTWAACWGEAAQFWREQADSRFAQNQRVTQQVALSMSRYATLFPYPMGGQPNHRGVRVAAARALREALAAWQ